jgi:PEGA domain
MMAGKEPGFSSPQVDGRGCSPLLSFLVSGLLLVGLALAVACVSAPLPGTVAATSEPPGAEVYLSGRYAGMTPIEITNLTPGEYIIRFRMKGYGDRVMTVVVEAGNRTAVTARYPPLPPPTPTPTPVVTVIPTTPAPPFVMVTPEPGSLSLRSFPSGASVTVNGVGMGKTPLMIRNLTPGTYYVRYSLVGWDDYNSLLSVSSGQMMTDDVTLRQ